MLTYPANKTHLLSVPILSRVRTHADKQKPHSFSFECGVLVAVVPNASEALFWLFDYDVLAFGLCYTQHRMTTSNAFYQSRQLT